MPFSGCGCWEKFLTVPLEKTTVLVVEDHEITRKGLRMFLERRENLEVVGEAEDGESAIAQAISLKPNIVLMDIGLPDLDGIKATDMIKTNLPQARVLMLTSHDSREDVAAAIAAGADGYCLKDSSLESLFEAIISVRAGRRWLDARLPNFEQAKQEESETPMRKHAQMLDQAYPHLVPGPSYCRVDFNHEFEPGVLFAGRYVIDGYVSRGGKGKLYKAVDSESGEFVAVKILNGTYDFAPDLLRTAEKEVMAISAIKHENIVSLRGSGGTSDGRPYIVMDFLNGQTLETIFSGGELIELPRFQRLFGQICLGLDAIHSKQMVHCDVKPSNIIIVNDGDRERVKLVDFGLVRKVSPSSTSAGNTHMGVVVGSPAYMSPEQCQGRRVDFATDIYSLGCVMYEALTGNPPFSGNSVYEIFSKHIHEMPLLPSSLPSCRKVPRFLENTVLRCLRKDRKMRFQSALELKSYLDINLEAMTAID